mgnify:CR=1 FL=1
MPAILREVKKKKNSTMIEIEVAQREVVCVGEKRGGLTAGLLCWEPHHLPLAMRVGGGEGVY